MASENAAHLVLSNHIYEFQKGVRNLVLFTLRKDLAQAAVDRLNRLGIDNLVQEAGDANVNIYFGILVSAKLKKARQNTPQCQ
ncbi:MAG: DUF2023 family protein, partial [Marinilabiliaceae bacterium]